LRSVVPRSGNLNLARRFNPGTNHSNDLLSSRSDGWALVLRVAARRPACRLPSSRRFNAGL